MLRRRRRKVLLLRAALVLACVLAAVLIAVGIADAAGKRGIPPQTLRTNPGTDTRRCLAGAPFVLSHPAG